MTRGKSTTPVERLGQSVAKVSDRIDLLSRRLVSWNDNSDPGVMEIGRLVGQARVAVDALGVKVRELAESGYAPPKRRSTVAFQAGDAVKILMAHLDRYKDAYAESLRDYPRMLGKLVVSRLLESGEVVASCEGCPPVVARKSHLSRRKVR